MSNVPKIHSLREWKTPATEYEEARIVQTVSRSGLTEATYRIHKSKWKKGVYDNQGVRGIDYINVDRPYVPITSLQQWDGQKKKWRDLMVDDPPQWWSMLEYAKQSKGNVLTTGLGLGLYVHALLHKDYMSGFPDKIRTVTVVERSLDVLELVSKYLEVACREHGKSTEGLRGWGARDIKPKSGEEPWLTIVPGDFYDFISRKDLSIYDTILIDLWVSSSLEQTRELLYREVIPLLVHLTDRLRNNRHTSISFHGFPIVSQIQPWPKDFVPFRVAAGKGWA